MNRVPGPTPRDRLIIQSLLDNKDLRDQVLEILLDNRAVRRDLLLLGDNTALIQNIFIDALKTQDEWKIRPLLSEDLDLNFIYDSYGKRVSPLIDLINFKEEIDLDLLKLLLDAGADPNFSAGRETPLTATITNLVDNRDPILFEVIAYLLNYGGEPEIPNKKGDNVYSLLKYFRENRGISESTYNTVLDMIRSREIKEPSY